MNKWKRFLICLIIAVIPVLVAVGCESESAYDIAVRNGFVGTEQQWLASLHGTNGTDGKDITPQAIYEYAVSQGFEGSYEQFLDNYLSFDPTTDNSNAISTALRSAVTVVCDFTATYSQFTYWGGWQTYDEDYTSSGAGVIYKINNDIKTAYIITNYHVVYSKNSNIDTHISDSITIKAYGGQEIKATYLGGSMAYDIAVLSAQSDYFATDFPIAATLSTSDTIVGQTAIAIGNPAAYGMSVTSGIVSVDSEYISVLAVDESSTISMRVIRIDTAVNSGNSGGGLFDDNGNLIGIVNAKISDSSIENMGYAIPISIASKVADQILKTGTFTKCSVGLSFSITQSRAQYVNGKTTVVETIKVSIVSGNSVGIIQEGDIIVSVTVGGKSYTITRLFHITDLLLSCTAGDTIVFEVMRNDSPLTLSVTCQ